MEDKLLPPSNFLLSPFLHYSKVWFLNCLHVCLSTSSLAWVRGKKPQEGQEHSPLCYWLWYHDDPWQPEGEVLETFLCEALSQLVYPNEVSTKMCNVVLQQRIPQLNFFKMLWKAYPRNHSYLTKFDLLLQRLKQNQCLNNWTVKIFFLFPSQIDPVLTDIFREYSVCNSLSTKSFSMKEC